MGTRLFASEFVRNRSFTFQHYADELGDEKILTVIIHGGHRKNYS